jgi:RHS repeat-associated protein
VTFKYDPLGRRTEKVSPTFTSIFAYDGDNLVETTNSSGAVVARYTQTQNIDEPLAELRSSATNYYEEDGLGSITSMTSSAGAIANTYTYDSFGDVTHVSGSVSNPFSYTGRELDSETGLYNYRARYYDQTTGRFVSEDPIKFLGGANFYRYGRNNPLIYRDPSGKDPLLGVWIGALAGGIYGGLGAAAEGGSLTDILEGAGIGAISGAAIGAIDPTAGVATLALLGGASAGVADLTGQALAGAGTRCKPFNIGHAIGAVAGGALGGWGAGTLGAAFEAIGLSDSIPIQGGIASITSGPGALLPGIGGNLVSPSGGGECACQ